MNFNARDEAMRLVISPSNPAPDVDRLLGCHRQATPGATRHWMSDEPAHQPAPMVNRLSAPVGSLLMAAGTRLATTGAALRDLGRAA